MKKLLTPVFLCLFIHQLFATGYDIKTSSVIDQPGTEVLGDYKGSWYVIGFEAPGTLNKPPRYKIFKYSTGFKTGKISELYPSFGEKTVYLRSAFVNNKISMFYSKCGKREDVTVLLDNRDGRKQLPVILRQDYAPETLEPAGEPVVVFNEEDEFFSPSEMEMAESYDKSKSAILFKPYYKQQKYKVIVTDNATGTVFSKTFDFKLTKEYLKFLKIAVSNTGNVYLTAKVRDDVITLNSTGNEGQTKYYLFSINKNSEDKPKSTEIISQQGKCFKDPLLNVLKSGEAVVAYDFYSNEKDNTLKGTVVSCFDASMNVVGQKEVMPDAEFSNLAGACHSFKKGKECTNLKVQQILALEGRNFMVVAEYCDSLPNADKTKPVAIERNYIITYRFDEMMNVSAQHFIPKKQISSSVDYAFSAITFAKGNDACLFYNADWEADEEHNMNLQCAYLSATGAEPEIRKVVNTSNDFFTSMQHVFSNSEGKILLTAEKLVEYGMVSREVKLLEVTIK